MLKEVTVMLLDPEFHKGQATKSLDINIHATSDTNSFGWDENPHSGIATFKSAVVLEEGQILSCTIIEDDMSSKRLVSVISID